ncbi:developmentally-regulated protein [Acrasis kona]|uniref:Developmentally-regulated protein n=1 Tax=Acrasis kona TaxID=1008807 RepID=A0AAW2ZM57_9EUKA
MNVPSLGLKDISGSYPNKFGYPVRSHVNITKEKETISNGFETFNGCEYKVSKLTDTARRHYTQRDSDSAEWRSSIRTISEPRPIEKNQRKKSAPPSRGDIKDKKEGRAYINPGRSDAEYSLMQSKHKVFDESGAQASQITSGHQELEPGFNRKIQVHDVRNGVGESTLGDKPYNNVICSPGYFAPKSTEHRSHVSAFEPKRTSTDLELLEKKRQRNEDKERQKDVALVKDLDNWMPPAVAKRLEEEKQAELKRQQDEAKNKKTGKKDAKGSKTPIPKAPVKSPTPTKKKK